MLGGRRRIVLGVSGQQTLHLIGWATMLVRPGDIVRIVHGYRPIPYSAVDWQLPVDNDNLVRGATERHVRAAAARLRRYRPDIVVVVELTGNPAGTALAEAARGADLVLVGVPHGDRSRTVLAQLLAEVGCPVVVVGAAEPAVTGPITAVLQGNDADDAVLQAGFAEAHRRHRGLLVLKAWQPPLDGARHAESAEQHILDSRLATWRNRYPDVRAAGELRLGDLPDVLAEQPANADLLVLNVPNRAGDQGALLSAVIPARTGPTMLIPAGSLALLAQLGAVDGGLGTALHA
jgi:nucleotide-binding universal stress UspA family protein